MAKKYVTGFQCLSEIPTGALATYPVTIATAIEKGDALILTSGYAALATTLATATFAGIALDTNTAAEAVASGTVSVQVIRPLPSLQFRVAISTAAIIALSDVGTCLNIANEISLSEAATVTAYWGFFVDAIDVSAAAILINTYGYAIGHFEKLSTT